MTFAAVVVHTMHNDAVTRAEGRVVVRRATAVDAAAVAELRWLWRTDERGETGPQLDGFTANLTTWIVEHLDSHIPFVAMRGHRHVGMAFLTIVERVPGVREWTRLSGEIQSAFVLPEYRGGGIGLQLMERIIVEARQLHLKYLAVHPSMRSIALYRRIGFTDGGGVLGLRLSHDSASPR